MALDELLKEEISEQISEEAPHGYKKSGKARKKPKLKDREGWQKFTEVFPKIAAPLAEFIPGVGEDLADIIRGIDGPSEEEKAAAIAFARQLELDIFKAEIEDKKSAREMNQVTSQSTDSVVRRFPYFLSAGILLTSFLFQGMILFGKFEVGYDNMIVGGLIAAQAAIIQFFFGSSMGSKMKDKSDTSFK